MFLFITSSKALKIYSSEISVKSNFALWDNLFIVRNGELITPGVDQDILEGITRASVIELAKSVGINVLERPVDKTELLIADEVFLTGTAAKITPVKKIESTDLNAERPIMNKLKSKLIEITEGRSQDYDNWVTRISI